MYNQWKILLFIDDENKMDVADWWDARLMWHKLEKPFFAMWLYNAYYAKNIACNGDLLNWYFE